MSINKLLEDPEIQSKPWANVYVDTLTAYKGIRTPDVSSADTVAFEATPSYAGTDVAPVALQFQKIGKMVFLWVNGVAVTSRADAGKYVFPEDTIPEEFRPAPGKSVRVSFLVEWRAPGSDYFARTAGYIFIEVDGSMIIGKCDEANDGLDEGNFPAGGRSGWSDNVITYIGV